MQPQPLIPITTPSSSNVPLSPHSCSFKTIKLLPSHRPSHVKAHLFLTCAENDYPSPVSVGSVPVSQPDTSGGNRSFDLSHPISTRFAETGSLATIISRTSFRAVSGTGFSNSREHVVPRMRASHQMTAPSDLCRGYEFSRKGNRVVSSPGSIIDAVATGISTRS